MKWLRRGLIFVTISMLVGCGKDVTEPTLDVSLTVSEEPTETEIAPTEQDAEPTAWVYPPTQPFETSTPLPSNGMLGDVVTLGRQRIVASALSPDGAMLLVGSRDGIALHQVETLEELWFRPTEPVVALAWKPDSLTFVSLIGQDVTTWNAHTGEALNTFPVSYAATWGSFSPDASVLVIYSRHQDTILWDVASGLQTHALEDVWGEHLKWSQDGTFLAAGQTILNVETGEIAQTIDDGGDDYCCAWDSVALSANGTIFAAGSWDEAIRVWDATTGELLNKLPAEDMIGHPELSFSPDGTRLAYTDTLQGGLAVRVISVKTGDMLWSAYGTGSLVFSRDGALLIATAPDAVYLIDAVTGAQKGAIGGYTYDSGAAAFSPDGSLLATSSVSRVNLWDVHSGAWLRSFSTASRWADLSWSADGQLLAVGIEHPVIWEVQSGKRLFDLDTGLMRIYINSLVAFAPQGNVLAASDGNFEDYPYGEWLGKGSTEHYGDGDRVNLWDARTGRLLHTLFVGAPVGAIEWSSDGTKLATAWVKPPSEKGAGGFITIWDSATGEEIRTFSIGIAEYAIAATAWIPGQSAIAIIRDYEVEIWDSETGQQITWLNYVDAFPNLAAAPDGTYLAAQDSVSVYVWNARTFEVLDWKQYIDIDAPEHDSYFGDYLLNLAISPDGSLIALTSYNTIRLVRVNR